MNPTQSASNGKRPAGFRVVWAGARQAEDLAYQLSDSPPVKAGANLAGSCIESRASLLVLSNRTSFGLCSYAIPHGFSRVTTRRIVAAVGGGPHSALASLVADRLARSLGVPAMAVCGYSNAHEVARAEDIVNATAARLPHMETSVIQAASPAAMVSELPQDTLLVVGAPGGSWFQRRFFGPGARIRAKAQGGTIVVNHNPSRVYQVMQPATAYGPQMHAQDALRLSSGDDVIIAQDGTFVGTVSHKTLMDAHPDAELHMIMDDALFLSADEEVDEALGLVTPSGARLIPVVDRRARLVGCVSGSDLHLLSIA